MSVLLRRVAQTREPGAPFQTHSEVCMINARKVTSALLAGAEVDGHRAASRWVFVLDNGQRFEADEVKIDGDWKRIDAALADRIVDGPDVEASDLSPAAGHQLGEG